MWELSISNYLVVLFLQGIVYLRIFSSIHKGSHVLLGRDSARTVRWRSIHESKSRIKDGIATSNNCTFIGLFGSNTARVESGSAIVLLVDTGSSSSGFLLSSSIEDNINIGLKRKIVIISPRCCVESIRIVISNCKEIQCNSRLELRLWNWLMLRKFWPKIEGLLHISPYWVKHPF